jgi:hypothetical protein
LATLDILYYLEYMINLNPVKSPLGNIRTVFPVGTRPWKSRALAGVIFGCALLMGGAAAASTTDADNAVASSSHVAAHKKWLAPEKTGVANAFVQLGVIDSAEGEKKNDYMMRVAGVLHAFTAQTNYEACGGIMKKEDGIGWRVRLITNRSHLGCVSMVFDEPGYQVTYETIHSHPRNDTIIQANARDEMLRGIHCGRKVAVDGFDFSPGDLENGSGYLVTHKHLLYQNGGDNRVIIGKINPKLPLSQMTNEPYRSVNSSGEFSSVTATTASWSENDADGQPVVSCPARKHP